jgi:hypothetical protein
MPFGLSFNWAMASGDAKSQNPNLLRTRTFCSELFSRQTHTPIDWKFHCASFAVWVCRLNVSLQRVTAVQKFGNKNIWQQKKKKKCDDAAALTTARPLCAALAGAALRSRWRV